MAHDLPRLVKPCSTSCARGGRAVAAAVKVFAVSRRNMRKCLARTRSNAEQDPQFGDSLAYTSPE
jgi:hypothetical protein